MEREIINFMNVNYNGNFILVWFTLMMMAKFITKPLLIAVLEEDDKMPTVKKDGKFYCMAFEFLIYGLAGVIAYFPTAYLQYAHYIIG